MVPGRKYSHMKGRCESARTVLIYFALTSFDANIRLVYWPGKYSMTAVRPSLPIWFRRTPRSRKVYAVVSDQYCAAAAIETYRYDCCVIAMESDIVSREGVVELSL